MSMSVTQSGVYLSGVEELAQSLSLYFRTPKGSIPLHPERGFGIFDYVDKNIPAILNLIREVRTGVELWDTRINLVSSVPIFEPGKLKLIVRWNPKTDSNNVIQSTFYL